MPYAFFWIPVTMPEAAQEDLNRFLNSHRVLAVDRALVQAGPSSGWSVAVDYADSPVRAGNAKPRVDYREVLDPRTFAVFAVLRSWRKHLAERDGVPAYAILTNEQLAGVAELQPTTLDGLKAIEGLGESRLRKYGRDLLEAVRQAAAAEAASAPADPTP